MATHCVAQRQPCRCHTPRRSRHSSIASRAATVQSGVLMLILYQVLSRGFKGVAVARLPFEPMPLLRYFTHRGLPADADPRNVSVVCHQPPSPPPPPPPASSLCKARCNISRPARTLT